MPSKADIWMPLYIGDYLADTSHLDAQRHGCYLLWMMHYWRKGPLSNNLEDLINIGKLRGVDAPSIAQALLKEFFTLDEDGSWHQKRIDAEIIEWRDKSLKAKEKASLAAAARWNKDAPSIPPSNPPGNPQEMLPPCPSPSPLPSPLPLTTKAKKQKLSTEGKPPVDPRFGLFKSDFETHFGNLNNVPASWDAKEASHLSRWLKANPTITQQQWRNILRNRRDSPINKSASLSTWISKAFSWLNDIADEWGKPINGGNNNGTGKIDRTVNAAQRVINRIENSSGSHGVELLSGGGSD